MTDKLSVQARSLLMSKVRSSDTRPEMILRSGLHRVGFRFRLRNRRLPGQPDLVLSKYRSVIFVHGCFWHGHHGCKNASIPKSKREFWVKKLSRNRARDAEVQTLLKEEGWNVLVVWECELENDTVGTIERTATLLRSAIEPGRKPQYQELPTSKAELLAVADKKVRYRIRSYDSPDKS